MTEINEGQAPGECTHFKKYDYRDEKGDLLFQVVRKPSNGFFVRRPDGKSGWIANLDGVRQVLYRLPDIINKPDEIVFVVEGEKDADRLADEGVLATTNPSGPGRWRDEYSESLKGRDVAVLPDNDDEGRHHAEAVARSLHGKARIVKVVKLPGIPDKGDVSDWLGAGNRVEELGILTANALPWKPIRRTRAKKSSDGQGTGTESEAKRLVRIVLESGAVLFHDENEEPYMALPLPDGRRIIPLDPKQSERSLRRLAYESGGFVPHREAVSVAQQQLSSIACFDGPEHPLHVRVAEHDCDFWLDLDGAHAVRTARGHWSVLYEPPPMFRSFPHQQPLPKPVRGGDPWQIMKSMNLPDRDSELLVMCAMVTALVPGISNPILVLYGVEGSGKSITMETAKYVLDPNTVLLHPGVPDIREFFLAASQNRMLFFNNLTEVPDWLSNAMCCAYDCGGISGRQYYTNTQMYVLQFRPVIGMNGIPLVAKNPDLIDRSLIFELEEIPGSLRRDGEEMRAELEKARPYILGGLLDALAEARVIRSSLRLEDLRRTTSYAIWGAAAAKALGRDPDEFLEALKRNRSRQKEAALDANPFGLAVLGMMGRQDEWRGTASELLAEAKAMARLQGADLRDASWPKGPNKVWSALTKIKRTLLAEGIFVEKTRTGGGRLIILRRVRQEPAVELPTNIGCDGAQEPSDDTPISTVTPKSACSSLYDDGDDSDDTFPTSPGEGV